MSYEKKYKVKVKGTAPLLMNKYTWVKKEGPPGKDRFDAEKDVLATLHKNEAGLYFEPNTHFEAAMVKAATTFPLKGKKTYKDAFKGGVFVEPEELILSNQKYEIDVRAIVNGSKGRLPKARGMFTNWEVEFIIRVIDSRIDQIAVKDILAEAGNFHGVGDYRPKFGRFEIVDFQEIK